MPRWNRLIFPFMAVIERIDTTATSYDDGFREPTVTAADLLDNVGSRDRVDATQIRVEVQVMDEDFERLRAMANGDAPESFMDLTTHRDPITAAGLLGPDGLPVLGKQDRLVAIETMRGVVETVVPRRPGLYLHEIRPRGHGANSRRRRGSRRNLWFLHFRSRDLGPRR